MSPLTVFVLITFLVSGSQSASLRDYVNSAAHMVGLDSIVSEDVTESPESAIIDADAEASHQSHATAGCCDQLPQPPCAAPVIVEQKQIDIPVPVVAPAPAPCAVPAPCATPCAPVPVPAPAPVCAEPECPIDLDHARAMSHSKMWEVALKGKALAGTLTHILASPVVFTNSKISSAAGMLPDLMAAKGRIMGNMIAAPIQFMAGKSSLIAKGVHGVMVGVPVAIGTGVAAGASGLMEAIGDIRRQQEACICARRAIIGVEVVKKETKKEEKKEEKVAVINEPCPCPGSLMTAGSGPEERFTIDEPVTDTPVTESIGGNGADSRESVTDATFTMTTTTGDLVSEE